MESTYTINGMHCDHCVAHVKAEVAKIPGVTSTQLTLSNGVLRVESDGPIDFSAIQTAVEEAGEDYSVVG